MNKFHICVICKKKTKQIKKFEYFKKPKVEKKYNFFKENNYYRYYSECFICKHWSSNFKFDTKKFYEGNYTDQSYKNFELSFKKIVNLKKKKSDNYFRTKRIENLILNKFTKKPYILDVGSGLGVFPFSMVSRGFKCDALDPDPNMAKHIKRHIKLNKVFCSNFLDFKSKKKYNLITLNKVLEHVENPKRFLLNAKNLLQKNGYLYIELPDTEEASKKGKNREEFTIEHVQGFTFNSIYKLIIDLKLNLEVFKRIKEPSGKFTFYCFVKK